MFQVISQKLTTRESAANVSLETAFLLCHHHVFHKRAALAVDKGGVVLRKLVILDPVGAPKATNRADPQAGRL
jgi:hypothetical protein